MHGHLASEKTTATNFARELSSSKVDLEEQLPRCWGDMGSRDIVRRLCRKKTEDTDTAALPPRQAELDANGSVLRSPVLFSALIGEEIHRS